MLMRIQHPIRSQPDLDRVRGLNVSVNDVSRYYGPVKALDAVSIDVAAGEFLSLLGPSGSGKTTLLMMLAGFEVPSSGRLTIGDRDVTHVPPNKRNLGMVFQRYALFPHMSVAENIAFPLKMRGLSRAQQAASVRRALDMVQLEQYQNRMPGQLSGGQQQRVALARAIVFEPPVVLMDEPLGALDKKLREHLQIEIKQLQERMGATMIYVTHDQEEALTMSDRVAVLSRGKLMQVGSPKELYDRPSNAFVADFIGNMNFLRGVVSNASGDSLAVDIDGARVEGKVTLEVPKSVGAKVQVAVRPERIRLKKSDSSKPLTGALTGTVLKLIFNGGSLAVLVEIRKEKQIMRVDVDAQSEAAGMMPGDNVSLTWSVDDAHVFREAV